MSAPFKRGDLISIEHTCHLGLGDTVRHTERLLVRSVTPLNTGSTWRVGTDRCDGSPLLVVVDHTGAEATT